MTYVILFLITCLGFIELKNKRFDHIVQFLIIGYFWVIIGLNSATPDFAVYEDMYHNYNAPQYALHEPGFLFLCGICKILGLSFQQFRMIEATILSILLVAITKKLSIKYNAVLVLFILSSCLGYASGLRQALGSTIAAFTICYLFSDSPKANIKFVVGILTAVTFHYSAFFFIILIFAKKRRKIKNMVIIILLAELFAFGLVKNNLLYHVVSEIFVSEKISGWFNYSQIPHPSLFSVSCLVAVQLVLIYIVYISAKDIRHYYSLSQFKKSVFNDLWSEEKNLATILNINYLMLLLIPGYLLHFIFVRILLSILIIDFAVIEHAIGLRMHQINIGCTTSKILIFQVYMIFIAILGFLYSFLPVTMALNNNYLFSLFL